jgi:integrase
MEETTPIPWKDKTRKHRTGGHGRYSVEDKGKIMENKKKGWWADHQYPERMSRFDIREFVGWKKIQDILDACKQKEYSIYMNADELIKRDIALITTLFLTGGRIREVLNLRRRNFIFSHENYITCHGSLLEKRFLKTRLYHEILREPPR